MKKMKIQSEATQDARFESILLWAERGLWMAFCLGTALLAFESFLHIGRPWFEPVFYTRLSLCVTAALAQIWLLGDRRLPEMAAALYLLAWMGSQALFLILSGTVSPQLLEFSGVLLIAAAILFRGPRLVWWWVVAPGGAIAILAPLVALGTSRIRGVQFDEFWTALGGPVLAIFIASIIAVLRDTRGLSLEARAEMRSVLSDQLRLMRTLRELERRAKSVLNLSQPGSTSLEPEVPAVAETLAVEVPVAARVSSLAVPPPTVSTVASLAADAALVANTSASELFADGSREGAPGAALAEAETEVIVALPSSPESPVAALGVTELSDLFESVVQEVRAQCRDGQLASRVRFIVTGSLESSAAVSVRGAKEVLVEVLRALVLHSVDSIGGGDGVVRASWRLNVASLHLILEDNGRGMSEDLLLRLEEKNQSGSGRLRLAQVRSRLADFGGRLDLSARLGVGSRMVLELPRTDAVVASTLASAPVLAQKPRPAAIRQPRQDLSPALPLGREVLQPN